MSQTRRLSAETRARQRNRRDEQRLPLFAGTPVLEQVLGRPQWTPERVADDDERHQQAIVTWQRQIAERHRAAYDFYRAWLVSLVGEMEVRRLEAERALLVQRSPSLGQGEYQADWLCGLVAQHAGLSKLEVFTAEQEALRHETHLEASILP